MAAARKYRTSVRVKVRRRFLRRTGAAFSAVAAAAIIVYAGCGVFRRVSSLSPGRFFSFTLKSVSVASPSAEVSDEVSRRISRYIGAAFSAGDAQAFAAALKRSYPALSRVEVERSFMTGRVTVRAESERIAAKVRLNGTKDAYLSESGRLLEESLAEAPADAFETELSEVPGSGLRPLAGFFAKLRTLAPEFSSRPVKIGCRGPADSCRLTLENGAEVLWGELEFTRSKVLRLNQILADAGGRIKGRLKIDFRYFRDGKVFVSKLSDI